MKLIPATTRDSINGSPAAAYKLPHAPTEKLSPSLSVRFSGYTLTKQKQHICFDNNRFHLHYHSRRISR
ncbi:hypothetical protein GMOD_00004328 [Pyrenophora seminiperda CCB06]|uniref:Uncharacterized protein n=1 Tax=Pyrenophora seminiperda CCB06 TaxID=1302712 RepID=A0A3M7M159_9PLEO|nr:hypothetical protein GMOD_00004328 [Pyrenophora seminiperda CCB06]